MIAGIMKLLPLLNKAIDLVPDKNKITEQKADLEKEDHYIIKIESYELGKYSAKKNIFFKEYSSGSVKFMSINDLKKTMNNLSWVI